MNYYVYVRPGEIYYFNTIDEAYDVACYYGVPIKEVETDEIVENPESKLSYLI